ncbi:hypothetical protein H6G91_31160 [Nostoc muscorum FACHB-395]|nr:hypothetical protein [Desmonostoc muscorum FACHB-395]
MIDFSLTQKQEMLQSLAREFAQNEISPIVQIIEECNSYWAKVRSIDIVSGLFIVSTVI